MQFSTFPIKWIENYIYIYLNTFSYTENRAYFDV